MEKPVNQQTKMAVWTTFRILLRLKFWPQQNYIVYGHWLQP